MVWRQIAAGIAGMVLWWVLFFVIGVGIGLLWPDFREAAHVMFKERSFHLFTLPMLFANLLLFAVAGIVAGRVSTLIAKSSLSSVVVAVLLLIYAITEHYIFLWGQLPAWYNLIVPLVIGGSVWLGGRTRVIRTGVF